MDFKTLFAVGIASLALGAGTASAQVNKTDIQLHYNFGKHLYKEDLGNQTPVISTLQHYSEDRWGTNFVLMDMSISCKGMDRMQTMMFRDLKFWDAPIALHVGYQGGLTNQASFNNALVSGIDYVFKHRKYDFRLNTIVGYRHDFKHEKPNNIQVTSLLDWTSWNRLWTISNLLTVRSANLGTDMSSLVFFMRPQFWLNINQFVGMPDALNLSVGTEVRLLYDKATSDKFYALPSVAMKWTF